MGICYVLPSVTGEFFIYEITPFRGYTRQYDSLFGPFPSFADAQLFAGFGLEPGYPEGEIIVIDDPERIREIMEFFESQKIKKDCLTRPLPCFSKSETEDYTVECRFIERPYQGENEKPNSATRLLKGIARLAEKACKTLEIPVVPVLLHGTYACVYYGDDTSSPQMDILVGEPISGSEVNKKFFEILKKNLNENSVFHFVKMETQPSRILLYLGPEELRISLALPMSFSDEKLLKNSRATGLGVYIPDMEVLLESLFLDAPEGRITDEIDDKNHTLIKQSRDTLLLLKKSCCMGFREDI